MTSRLILTFAVIVAMLSTGVLRLAWAEDLAMPAELEAKLSGKVASYERTFAQRAGDRVTVAILAKAGDSDSTHAAALIQAAFRALDDIAGLPHDEIILQWKDSATLAEACQQRKVGILFIAPGLGSDITTIVKTIEPFELLSIAGALSYVDKGVVLGFDLVSGRPKVVINLGMAKRQNLKFRSDLLSLARIID